MPITIDSKKRDLRRRNLRTAIAKREDHLDGVPIKQRHHCTGDGKHIAIRAREMKHGERRRISVAMTTARRDHELDIVANPHVGISRLYKTAHYHQ